MKKLFIILTTILFPLMLNAQMIEGEHVFRTIEVTGFAERQVDPDLVYLTAGFEEEAVRTKEAIEKLSQNATKLINQLEAISAEDIKITLDRVDIRPLGKGLIWEKFHVSQALRIELRKLDLLPQLVDALADAKPQFIGDIRFIVENETGINRELIQSAAKDARAQALAIIAQTGGKLGAPLEVGDDLRMAGNMNYETPVVVEKAASASASIKQMPAIDPSKIRLSQYLRVRYEILPEVSASQ